MSLYLQFGWCYVFVPSVWMVLCLCTFSMGGGMSLYLQHEWCYVFVPSVWVVLFLCTFSLGGAMSLYLLKVQRHSTTQTEGTKT
jgi:hypothetical protein